MSSSEITSRMLSLEIRCFDAWAAIFAKKTTDFEFNVTNNIVQKERFRYFARFQHLDKFGITDFFPRIFLDL